METNQETLAAHQQKIDQNLKDIEENTSRFTALSEYDVKGEATVTFGVGSSNISAPHQEQLKTLAENAVNLRGYIIEVTGYADSTGSAAMNTKLSEDRAKAVITYLIQQSNVPMRHIVAPGAMGEYDSSTNEVASGALRTVGLRLRSWSTRASPVVKITLATPRAASQVTGICKCVKEYFFAYGICRHTH